MTDDGDQTGIYFNAEERLKQLRDELYHVQLSYNVCLGDLTVAIEALRKIEKGDSEDPWGVARTALDNIKMVP